MSDLKELLKASGPNLYLGTKLQILRLLYYVFYKLEMFPKSEMIVEAISQKKDPMCRILSKLLIINDVNDNLLKEWSLLLEKLSDDDFKELLAFLNHYNSTESATEELEALSTFILGKSDAVLDYCSGEGSFLSFYGNKYPKSRLFGIEIHEEAYLTSVINLDLQGFDHQIYHEDAIQNNTLFKEANEFDRIYSNFPINLMQKNLRETHHSLNHLTKYNFNALPERDNNWLFVTHVVNLLSAQGKAVVVAPLMMLYRESQKPIRDEYLEKGLVEAIIQLPERTLNYVSIPMALLILSPNNKEVRLVDATDAYTKGRRTNHLDNDLIIKRLEGDSEYAITLSNEILIQEYDSWLPRNILLHSQLDYDGTQLDDLTEDLFRGAQINRRDLESMKKEPENQDECVTYQIVSLSSFDDGIHLDQLETIYPPQASYDRYLIQNHDILMTARGTLFKIGLVEIDQDARLIATGNVTVIRLDPARMNPLYVFLFLKSPKGQRLLESIQKGSKIFIINNKDLAKLKIPVIPRGKQDALVDKYLALKDQKRLHQKRLKRLDEDIHRLYDIVGDI